METPIFKLSLQKWDVFDVPPDSYVLTGSAILAQLGLRDVKDLDVIVSPKVWDDLQEQYGQIKERGLSGWGLHASRELRDAWIYRPPAMEHTLVLCRVQLRGHVIEARNGDKLCATARKVLWARELDARITWGSYDGMALRKYATPDPDELLQW